MKLQMVQNNKQELSINISAVEWRQFQKTFRKAIVGNKLATINLSMSMGELYITYIDRLVHVKHNLGTKAYGHIEPINIPAKVFLDSTKKIKDSLDLSVENNVLTVHSGIVLFQQQTSEVMGHADIPGENFDHIYSFDFGEMKKHGPSFLRIVKSESVKSYDSVVNLSRDEFGTTRICGTDGFRLHCLKSFGGDKTFNICLSHKAWSLFCTATHKPSELCTHDTSNLALLDCGRLKIAAKLSSVKYPKYDAVIPNTNESFCLSRELCSDIVKSTIPTLDKSMAMPLQKVSPDLPNIIVNARFLKDALASGRDRSATFNWTTNDLEKPLVVSVSDAFSILVPIHQAK